MKKKKLLAFFGGMALLGISIGCTTLANGAESGALQIRIANRSGQDFERVSVTLPSDTVDYGRVGNGAVTNYRRVTAAYRYALVEVTIGGKPIKFQPQDYLGEEPLRPGRYTYELRLDEDGNNLRLELVTDR
ncbi:MAG TPA: hypothetical protein VHC97_26475 [Thermoanaerobaculia bacterium]|jgi:hypothetical protein|nr:hypothetical protein [Thermoanaerobaculia bacterium]